ncbi:MULTISPECIES: Lrp/AsnC family transcriptional regulator [Clostridium]|jgi:DNA-binding Lrp family transcriptional regulator|uniref:Transcriptional regulator, AsnC family n=1 Tax=Clostridium saccharoperbutylacetonicum N1-4(HMT) TaxID=931276 RepID=M1MV71_9CLOT|nr:MULTISPECIES: Lrp/AsnC family transcriptional regulator [Clostridium]AGF55412.1 transcriptional regulator, AsnC family [Clostridium saccharoperbutylacetonicum N1-4(HMT)]AQR94310.1 leucine-responsive regulatory protein [Clostridium saccharoperbutylacetonicum]NRT63874.1 DNA-binding Lrp family transcriptional regulator [Clostridium saccharoperbutylacetonicum]NSB27239.1 DNA-binding Lrp family transcriptional regulator [Clostridium saccharoperbutylacetonicum]NSB30010.1 DNA-binding Lrp family tra
MEEILEILEKNSRYSDEEIAVMAGKTVEEVREAIRDYEEKSIIAGYTTLINWENTGSETVTALIEVKITPQRGEGFDKVAERIYKFSEVKACYLMSGGFDLTVIVEGKTMKQVALFVSEKLAVQQYVLSTATHFVLKKYKDHGTIFKEKKLDDREAIFI